MVSPDTVQHTNLPFPPSSSPNTKNAVILTCFEPGVHRDIPVHDDLHKRSRCLHMHAITHTQFAAPPPVGAPAAPYHPHTRQKSRRFRQVAHKVVAETERLRIAEGQHPPVENNKIYVVLI